ncbi:MAG: LemA family protein [Candidatus Omnitrophica bacterium]|nr:LemA family protein [Candidatus Omnitrophota bacterium]
MKKIPINFATVTITIVVLFITIYLAIVLMHSAVAANWTKLENQLQRRNEIILNLTNNVKGYALQEKATFEDINHARLQWEKATSAEEKIRSLPDIDRGLAKLLLASKNYPDLKTDQTFLSLTNKLSNVENNIAIERPRYNRIAKIYNIIAKNFPGNLIRGTLGYKTAGEYFKAKEKHK